MVVTTKQRSVATGDAQHSRTLTNKKNIGVSKYRNIKTEVGGIKFDSKKEAKRWGELKLLERAGEIRGLERQKRFDFRINGVLVCYYKADFVYDTKEGKSVIEDCKGMRTPTYNLKKKLMKAVFGLEIHET